MYICMYTSGRFSKVIYKVIFCRDGSDEPGLVMGRRRGLPAADLSEAGALAKTAARARPLNELNK